MKTLNLNSEIIDQKEKKESSTNMTSKVEATGIEKNESKLSVATPATAKKETSITRRIANNAKKLMLTMRSLSPAKKIAITALFCFSVVAIGGLFIYTYVIKVSDNPALSFPDHITASQPPIRLYEHDIPLSFPSEPRTTPNPINGELYTKKQYAEMRSRFPLAVIIENQVQARPQSGYNSADIVFETLAEGGITRTIAVFWGEQLAEIGPVRSLRVYFYEWVAPFDPIIMHIGYAISDDARIDVTRLKYNGVYKSLDRGGTFWRSNQRYAPHNAYTSSALLYEKAATYGLTGTPQEIESWLFKSDAAVEDRGTVTGANIVFFERLWNGGLYDISWKYDASQNQYLRYNGDTPYTDANTNSIVAAKNVIIQRLSVVSAYDEKAHMIVTTTGTGDAIILRDGQAINGTWSKESVAKRTRYYDADGNEIEFNRGTIWVEAVPTDLGTVQLTPI